MGLVSKTLDPWALRSSCSVTQLCPTRTPWTAAHQASLSFTILQGLLRLLSIQSVMLSNHLILFYPLLLSSIFASIRVFSDESVLHIPETQGQTGELSLSQVNFQGSFTALGLQSPNARFLQTANQLFSHSPPAPLEVVLSSHPCFQVCTKALTPTPAAFPSEQASSQLL